MGGSAATMSASVGGGGIGGGIGGGGGGGGGSGGGGGGPNASILSLLAGMQPATAANLLTQLLAARPTQHAPLAPTTNASQPQECFQASLIPQPQGGSHPPSRLPPAGVLWRSAAPSEGTQFAVTANSAAAAAVSGQGEAAGVGGAGASFAQQQLVLATASAHLCVNNGVAPPSGGGALDLSTLHPVGH